MLHWDSDLYLFTPEELQRIPIGTELTSVTDQKKPMSLDLVDGDTRYGYTAYGVRDPWNHPLKDLFLIFKLIE